MIEPNINDYSIEPDIEIAEHKAHQKYPNVWLVTFRLNEYPNVWLVTFRLNETDTCGRI